jgi:hypothetical protein
MTESKQMLDDSENPRIAESFNIYQATMTMLSIFTGFVFAALLQIIVAPEQLDSAKKIAVRILIAALISFLLAIFSFHHAAHRMVRYWRIVLPRSVFVRIGGLGLIGGFMFMLFGLAILLWARQMGIEAIIVGIASVGLGGYAAQSRRMHHPKATYLRDVDHV